MGNNEWFDHIDLSLNVFRRQCIIYLIVVLAQLYNIIYNIIMYNYNGQQCSSINYALR